LHARDFTGTASLASTQLAQLDDAAGRKLVKAWNTAAQLDFTLDGRSQAASLVQELAHEVVAWRWDDTTGADVAMFRGPITQSSDQVGEETHVVNFTCHDYSAMLARRYLTSAYTATGADQDDVAADLVGRASNIITASGTSLLPGTRLPLVIARVNPDGTARPLKSNAGRTVTYTDASEIGATFDALAKLAGGFDYDVLPGGLGAPTDQLRVFFPFQGTGRTDIVFQYGNTVASFTRTVDSATFGNYWRAIGNSLKSETWGADAAAGNTGSVGLWMSVDNSSSDASTQSALDAQAAGDLAAHDPLVPVYTLTLAPGAYYQGAPNMGDTVLLLARAGRLQVNAQVRVLGLTYTIGDDGQEDVEVTVGQPTATLVDLMKTGRRALDAIARR
jgi:hypothetical protein